ncbi:MAG: chemotaxis protein CheW [bacterium]
MALLNTESDELQLIAFKLGKEEYTVPIETVQEIIMPQITTHIPKSPRFVEGIINLRGHIIPVIDGRKRFDIEISENNADTRVIVLELDDHTVGLIVDSVSEVVHLKKSNIEPTPIESDENSFIVGVGKHQDRLLLLLDASKILDIKETEHLKQTLEIANKVSKLQETIAEANVNV